MFRVHYWVLLEAKSKQIFYQKQDRVLLQERQKCPRTHDVGFLVEAEILEEVRVWVVKECLKR
jgi:hypothetical protein